MGMNSNTQQRTLPHLEDQHGTEVKGNARLHWISRKKPSKYAQVKKVKTHRTRHLPGKRYMPIESCHHGHRRPRWHPAAPKSTSPVGPSSQPTTRSTPTRPKQKFQSLPETLPHKSKNRPQGRLISQITRT
jgi:hypothetical protein